MILPWFEYKAILGAQVGVLLFKQNLSDHHEGPV